MNKDENKFSLERLISYSSHNDENNEITIKNVFNGGPEIYKYSLDNEKKVEITKQGGLIYKEIGTSEKIRRTLVQNFEIRDNDMYVKTKCGL